MGRKSRVGDGWVSLYGLILEHRGSHDTGLAEDLADFAGIRVYRRGADGARAIREADVPRWLETLALWDSRLVRRRRRKRRADAGPRPRRRKWVTRPKVRRRKRQ